MKTVGWLSSPIFLNLQSPNIPLVFQFLQCQGLTQHRLHTPVWQEVWINISAYHRLQHRYKCLNTHLQQSSSLDFCRHQWTCWRAGHSSRKGLVLKQNAVTLIISYWSLISALLKGLIMMFNWLCRTNKHGLLSYHSFLPFCVCALSKRSLACHIAPSLSSSKTNKDVKHQSCSWLIKEDLKYFPLCLTWFWVSPTRGITTAQNKMAFFFFCYCCSVSVLRRLSRPNLILFFDLVGSNYSKVVFLSSLLRREPPSPLSPLTVPYSPLWLWYPEFPAKTTVCQRIPFLWSRCQSVVFQSWARALTPDLQWLLPWRSQAEITVNAGLWYPLENGRLSPKGNTMMVRHLSVCAHMCAHTHR